MLLALVCGFSYLYVPGLRCRPCLTFCLASTVGYREEAEEEEEDEVSRMKAKGKVEYEFDEAIKQPHKPHDHEEDDDDDDDASELRLKKRPTKQAAEGAGGESALPAPVSIPQPLQEGRNFLYTCFAVELDPEKAIRYLCVLSCVVSDAERAN